MLSGAVVVAGAPATEPAVAVETPPFEPVPLREPPEPPGVAEPPEPPEPSEPPVESGGVDAVGQALGAGVAFSSGITRVTLDSFPVVVEVELGHGSAWAAPAKGLTIALTTIAAPRPARIARSENVTWRPALR